MFSHPTLTYRESSAVRRDDTLTTIEFAEIEIANLKVFIPHKTLVAIGKIRTLVSTSEKVWRVLIFTA